MILFHNEPVIKKMKDSKCYVFCHVLNSTHFLLKGKLIRSNSVSVCMRLGIHLYAASPHMDVCSGGSWRVQGDFWGVGVTVYV